MAVKRSPNYALRMGAKRALQDAKYRGVIPLASSLQCLDCNAPASEYHHESYAEEDWLKVIPLCYTCHRARHNIAVV
jgi:hypothetical protein